MKPQISIVFIVLAVLLIGLSLSLYTVDEREQVIILQLGEPIGETKMPGLHAKIPFIQTVRRFDRRILSVDPQPEQMVISSNRDTPAATPRAINAPATTGPADDAAETDGSPTDGVATDSAAADGITNEEPPRPILPPVSGNVSGEPIIVDTFARYRINDPLKFMKTLRTTENANQRLASILNNATRTVLGRTTLRELLSSDRARIMQDIRSRVNRSIEEDELGIDIIDVRIVRADLTPELRQSTVRRMISELVERATETRARGEERALEIRSTAEKERTVLLAEAGRDAQIRRGLGDEEAIRIYALAYNQDKSFYDFNRSMEAYRRTMANGDTRLILSPDGAFFKYFKGQP